MSLASRVFTQPFIQAQIKEKTLKLRVTGLCEENSPVTGKFPAQRASNAEMCPLNDVINVIRHTNAHVPIMRQQK